MSTEPDRRTSGGGPKSVSESILSLTVSRFPVHLRRYRKRCISAVTGGFNIDRGPTYLGPARGAAPTLEEKA